MVEAAAETGLAIALVEAAAETGLAIALVEAEEVAHKLAQVSEPVGLWVVNVVLWQI